MIGVSEQEQIGEVIEIYRGIQIMFKIEMKIMDIEGDLVQVFMVKIIEGRNDGKMEVIMEGVDVKRIEGEMKEMEINIQKNKFEEMEIMLWMMGQIEES